MSTTSPDSNTLLLVGLIDRDADPLEESRLRVMHVDPYHADALAPISEPHPPAVLHVQVRLDLLVARGGDDPHANMLASAEFACRMS